MKTIVVLSGKGGTGKSSIAASLAVLMARKNKIVTADCDVDAPNLALVLGLEEKDFDSWQDIQTSEKAILIKKKCTGCKKCLNVCVFNAITWDEKNKIPVFNKFLCEGCGACQLVCPENAIKLVKVKNAKIGTGRTKYNFPIVSGQLRMGESGSGKVVDVVKQKAEQIANKNKADLILIDSAAGIGCPVIASVRGSDFVIAVTEPTPTAIHDLGRALKVVEYFKIPYGLVVNKFDLNKELTNFIINKYKDKILSKIPYDKRFVKALVNLTPIIVYDKSFEDIFSNISNKIEENINFK